MKQKAYGGKPTKTLCMHECVVFVVEIGCNTSHEGDGSYDGDRKID
jgi:hypothetical protein